MEKYINKVIQGDCLEVMKTFPDESIDCVMTSPPYWNLRDYGVEGQLGLEPTFQEYINKLCDIFDEVKRVLKKEGTCWVNMGDTYAGSGNGQTSNWDAEWTGKTLNKPTCLGAKGVKAKTDVISKCLLQIPSRFAIEMCNRGWILRNEIIWHKPNCMPSSVKDRFTVDFEKIFFFTKSKKYYFETQYEEIAETTKKRGMYHIGNDYNNKGRENKTVQGLGKLVFNKDNPQGRNKRCVWKITTKPYKEAHFATYPEELCETPIKAGCPEKVISCDNCGIVLGWRYETNAIYQMQKMWEKVSCEGRPLSSKKILLQAMQFFLGGRKQKNNDIQIEESEGLCLNMEQEKAEIRNGTQVDNGNTSKQKTIGERSSSSLKWDKRRQSDRELGDNGSDKTQPYHTKREESSADNLSSLWKENPSVFSCPKCGGNIRIRKGVILDCFFGAGTTGLVAKKQGKNYIGIELNPKYIDIINKRLNESISQTVG